MPMLTIWVVHQGLLKGSQVGVLGWWQFRFPVSAPLLNLHGIHERREWQGSVAPFSGVD